MAELQRHPTIVVRNVNSLPRGERGNTFIFNFFKTPVLTKSKTLYEGCDNF